MARQYTFKTTKDTEWIETFLNALPKSERSEFIRNSIIKTIAETYLKADKKKESETLDTPVSDKEVPNKPTEWTKSPEGDAPSLMSEQVSQEEHIDLDSKLDNIDFQGGLL